MITVLGATKSQLAVYFTLISKDIKKQEVVVKETVTGFSLQQSDKVLHDVMSLICAQSPTTRRECVVRLCFLFLVSLSVLCLCAGGETLLVHSFHLKI